MTFKQNSTVRMTTTKNYDFMNRLGQISSVPSASSVVNYSYLYNSANQRTERREPDSSFWLYQYDSLGQVTSGKKYWSDWTPVAGQQFEYVFDDIGNRSSTKSGGDSTGANLRSAAYSANNLNQYTTRDVPGTVDIIGAANAAATATVNGQSTYRKVEYYYEAVATNNGSAAIYPSITNQSVLSGATNVTIGSLFLPRTPEAFSYDSDGNLTNDGRWMLTWDAENRLTAAESQTTAPTASKRKVTFVFDWQGRTTRRTEYDGSSGSYLVSRDEKYVYDALRCLAELNATNNTVLRGYLWGLDLSGTTTGAGGVGGLLAMNSAANGEQFYALDGNGNVAELVKAADGTASANYEYDAFGQTIRISGTPAKDNPFRFSTKRYDDALDFALYEDRPYKPPTDNWLSRDTSEHLNEPNPYGFNRNDPVNRIDPDGSQSYALSGPDWYFTFEHGQWVYHTSRPPPQPPPYTSYTDDRGLNIAKVNKCNVVVFYGHGIGSRYSDGSLVDFTKLTVSQLNQSGTPAVVKNEPCSAAGVLGCNSGNYAKIQTPIVDAPQPNYEYSGFQNGPLIDQAWSAAIEQAKAICKKQGACCDTVRVRFECPNLSWSLRPAGWCGKEEIIKCK